MECSQVNIARLLSQMSAQVRFESDVEAKQGGHSHKGTAVRPLFE